MTIGERIRDRRIELGMTQDELAQKVGYKSRSSVNKIESSRSLPLSKVQKMADALDTSPSFLMGWNDSDSPQDVPLSEQYSPEEVEKAMELYAQFKDSMPQIQAAIEALLKK